MFSAGTPAQTAPGATSRTTTAPAPTVAPSPTFICGNNVAPAPIKTESPIWTPPPSVAFGAMWLKFPMVQS
jgi:hypothetical protein